MYTTTLNPNACIDQLFEDFDRGVRRAQSRFIPAVDIVEEENAYLLRVELPGVPKENLSLEVKENKLVLSGNKESTLRGEDGRYRYVESRSGSFTRVFELPRSVKTDAIEAQYKDGILDLRIPKTEVASSKFVDIK